MYFNVHYPSASLTEAPVKSPGLCSIKLFKIEDVLTWPAIDPQTGIISNSIELKPGKVIYLLDAIDQTRAFNETQKEALPGSYHDITVAGSLRGSNAAQVLTIGTLKQHQWGILVKDKSGITRMIGNEDSGADMVINYSSGNGTESRKTEFTFKWQHPQPAPIYSATAFEIIIGGLMIIAGCITFIQRFEVGASGSPMNPGDTLYINSLLVNKKALVIVDGMALPVDDFSGDIDWSTSIDRHIEKAFSSNTVNFVGGVMNAEKIEIYAYN